MNMTVPRFEREAPASGPRVQGFVGSSLKIDGRLFDGALLTPQSVEPWAPPSLELLALADLEPLLRLDPQPEFLLLGTGAKMRFAPRPLVQVLADQGVGIEAMDSRAAARTWLMLRGEERWIAAAIMPLATD